MCEHDRHPHEHYLNRIAVAGQADRQRRKTETETQLMQVPIEIYSPIARNSGRDAVWTGVVHDPDLDVIFRYFNRVDQADADRLRAIGYELPSMTAGDLIHFTEPDRWVLVCSLGFADLSDHHVSEILNSEDPYLTAMLYARGGGKIEAASTN